MAKLPEEPTIDVGGVLRFVRRLPKDAVKAFPVDIEIADGALRATRTHPTGATIRVDPRVGRFPSWLRAVDALQRSSRSPWVAAFDLVFMFAAGLAARVSMPQAAALSVAFLFSLYIAGNYADRGSLETQGVLWVLGEVSMPLALITLVGAGLAKPLGWSVALTLRFAGAAAGFQIGRASCRERV